VLRIPPLALAFLLTYRGLLHAQEFQSREAEPAAPAPEVFREAPPLERPPEAESAEQRKTHAITVCEQSVAGQLENSGFVNWPSRGQYVVRERGGGEFEVEGYVDTPNPTGDVRKPFTCLATAYGGRWEGTARLSEEAVPQKPVPEQASPMREPPAREQPMREQPMREPPALGPAPNLATANPRREIGEAGSCRSVTFRETYAEKHTAEGFQIVKGTIENSGSRPIWNVKVCASGTCNTVYGQLPPMERGATKEFAFKVPTLDVVTVTAQCSVVTEPM
jgi:hypothetical protein